VLKQVVTFGEIMMRLSTPGHQRFEQARTYEACFAGAEANVAMSLANFGVPVQFVSRLPSNDLGRVCAKFLRQQGVGVDHLASGDERLGLFFLEAGAAQRGSKVIYDRAQSGFASIEREMIDWATVFSGADWFHWTGVTPAVARGPAEVVAEATRVARDLGLTVSCDLNYRAKLWKWGRAPQEVMADLVGQCDIVIGGREHAEMFFGIVGPEIDVLEGQVDASKYVVVCERLVERFPNLHTVAITLRDSLSASHNTWSALLWHEGAVYFAPTYDIVPIVDGVGSGDAFAAGLIYGLGAADRGPQWALEFAVAASCLKHSIWGDANLVTVDEVEQLATGNASGRVVR
jgi:2-dehydro-3-deoxygluconokinase